MLVLALRPANEKKGESSFPEIQCKDQQELLGFAWSREKGEFPLQIYG